MNCNNEQSTKISSWFQTYLAISYNASGISQVTKYALLHSFTRFCKYNIQGPTDPDEQPQFGLVQEMALGISSGDSASLGTLL